MAAKDKLIRSDADLELSGSTLTMTGAADFSSTLDVTGATTLDSTLDVAGAATFTSASSLSLTLDSAASQDCSLVFNQNSSNQWLIGHDESPLGFRIYNYNTANTALFVKRADDRVGVGTTVPLCALHVEHASSGDFPFRVKNTSATNPYGMNVSLSGASPDNNTQYMAAFSDSTTSRCIIYSDGDVWTSDAGTLTSDERLKTNIQDATPKLDDLMKVKIKNFEWKEEYHPNKVGEKKIGVIAQEFEEVFPGLVGEHTFELNDEEVTRKSVRYGALIPILIKGMQEQQEIIESLEARLAALES